MNSIQVSKAMTRTLNHSAISTYLYLVKLTMANLWNWMVLESNTILSAGLIGVLQQAMMKEEGSIALRET